MRRESLDENARAQDAHDFLSRLDRTAVEALAREGFSTEGRFEHRDSSGRLSALHFHVADRTIEVHADGVGVVLRGVEGDAWHERKSPEPADYVAKVTDSLAGLAREERDGAASMRPGTRARWRGVTRLLIVLSVAVGIAIPLVRARSRAGHTTTVEDWRALRVVSESGEAGERLHVTATLADSMRAIRDVRLTYAADGASLCVCVSRDGGGGRRLDFMVPASPALRRLKLGCRETIWERGGSERGAQSGEPSR